MPKTAQPNRNNKLTQMPQSPLSVDSAKKIIASTAHHVEVLASPGSGKTHTLIARIQHLLATGVPAAQILVLSFSNEAVRELRSRMDFASTKPDVDSSNDAATNSVIHVPVSTAHAFALSLIAKPPAMITDSAQRKLLVQSIKMVRRQLGKGKIWKDSSTAKRQRRRDLLDSFKDSPGLVIPHLLALFDYKRAAATTLRAALAMPAFTGLGIYPVIRAVFTQYQELKRHKHYQDFADLLDAAESRLQQGKTRLKIKHILVDEFQDCSTAQTRLLALLAQQIQAQVMVFGDPAQSLYGFAGARYRSLSDFLPDVQSYQLPVSHRLTAQTAALASAILQLEPSKAIQTLRDGTKPVLVTSTSMTAQTHQVVADTQRLLTNGSKHADIAILARNKATLHVIEAALLADYIDCNRIGLARTNQHVLNVLRIVNWTASYHLHSTPVECSKLEGLRVKPLIIAPDVASVQASKLMRVRWPSSLEGQYQMCAQSYLRLLGGIRVQPEIRAQVNRWEPLCRQHTDAKRMRDALRMQLQTVLDTNITTGTIHASKGREWPHVLVVGVTDGVLPDYRARDDSTLMQERNLLYVAITRARDTVRLYHAPTPHAKTRQTFNKLNRHLEGEAVRKFMTTDETTSKSIAVIKVNELRGAAKAH